MKPTDGRPEPTQALRVAAQGAEPGAAMKEALWRQIAGSLEREARMRPAMRQGRSREAFRRWTLGWVLRPSVLLISLVIGAGVVSAAFVTSRQLHLRLFRPTDPRPASPASRHLGHTRAEPHGDTASVEHAPSVSLAGGRPEASPALVPAPTQQHQGAGPRPAARLEARPVDEGRDVLVRPVSAAGRGLHLEQVLLDEAREALTGGDARRSLSLLERDAREFPDGLLTEEREVIRIKALSASGRASEARATFETFRARFSGSLSLPALARALQRGP